MYRCIDIVYCLLLLVVVVAAAAAAAVVVMLRKYEIRKQTVQLKS